LFNINGRKTEIGKHGRPAANKISMKTKEFKAGKIAIETSKRDNYYLFGLADDEKNTQEYLIFQKSIKADEQDKDLGMDTYHLEIDDQAYSGYGICDKIVLSRDRLLIEISKKANKIVKKFDTVIVHFKATDKKFEEMIKMLKVILDDKSALLTIEK